jgi:ferritin-like metal-binding protein YciE
MLPNTREQRFSLREKICVIRAESLEIWAARLLLQIVSEDMSQPFNIEGAPMKQLRTLHDVFVDQLKDLYSAESQLIRSMPKMAKMSKTPELVQCLQEHLEVTERQRERLDEIGEILGEKLTGKSCKAMKGMLEEGREAEESDKGPLRDSLIVSTAQKIEHYEISGYGTARAMAQALSLPRVVELLDATIQEEGDADKKLTSVVYEAVYPQVPATEEMLEMSGARNGSSGRKRSGKAKSAR